MSQQSKPSKGPVILAIALVVAVALMIFMLVQRNTLSQQNETLASDLAASQESWQAISTEKEALQKDLEEAENNLKEAELSLAESVEKTEQLTVEVTALTEEKETLSGDLAAAIAVQEELNAYIATTTDLLAVTKESLATTTDLLVVTTQERDQLLASNTELVEKLNKAEETVRLATESLSQAREDQIRTFMLLRSHLELSRSTLEAAAVPNGKEADQKQKIADIDAQIKNLDEKIAEVKALIGK